MDLEYNAQENRGAAPSGTCRSRCSVDLVYTLRSDLEFIAKMLHVRVVEQCQNDSFYVCEAWEVAKKYYPNESVRGGAVEPYPGRSVGTGSKGGAS